MRLEGRPARRSLFLAAEWRYVAMLNYRVAPALLEPFIPAGTSLDLFEGTALVSVVAFLFLHTRVLGISIPFHRDFEEVNLRFYVQRRQDGRQRRGAVFVKELVPRGAIAAVARIFYNEQYFRAKMRHQLTHNERQLRIRFAWRFAGYDHSLEFEAEGQPKSLVEGSETQFIADHYWGYTRQRNGSTMEYEVSHPPWRVWSPAQWSAKVNWSALYGERFADTLSRPPSSVFIAEGSPVTISKGRRLIAPESEAPSS